MTPERKAEADAVCDALRSLPKSGASSDDVGPLRASLLRRLKHLLDLDEPERPPPKMEDAGHDVYFLPDRVVKREYQAGCGEPRKFTVVFASGAVLTVVDPPRRRRTPIYEF